MYAHSHRSFCVCPSDSWDSYSQPPAPGAVGPGSCGGLEASRSRWPADPAQRASCSCARTRPPKSANTWSCRGCGERVEGVFQEATGPRQERPNRPSRRCPRGARSFSTITPPHPPFLSPGTFLYPCTAGGSLTPHPWASPYRIKSVCI